MSMTKKEFKESITSKDRRLYLEMALFELLQLDDFDLVHHNVVIDDPEIIQDQDIPFFKRPDCIVLSVADRIILMFKNDSIQEKCDPAIYEITEKLSSKYSDKFIVAVNFNEFKE